MNQPVTSLALSSEHVQDDTEDASFAVHKHMDEYPDLLTAL